MQFQEEGKWGGRVKGGKRNYFRKKSKIKGEQVLRQEHGGAAPPPRRRLVLIFY